MDLTNTQQEQILNNIKRIIYNKLEDIQAQQVLHSHMDDSKWEEYFHACYDIYLMIKGKPFPKDVKEDETSWYNDALKYAERTNNADALQIMHQYDNGCCANCKHWDIIEPQYDGRQGICICKLKPECGYQTKRGYCDSWDSNE